jgi:hypothetical protein
MSRDREFELWVRERLSDWTTQRILEFERWLLEGGCFEFVLAVREAVRHRIDGDPTKSSKRRLVDDLLLHIKELVRVRAILEDRGASVIELAEHTGEIERLRARLAELVKASAA